VTLAINKHRPAPEGRQRLTAGSKEKLANVVVWEKLKPGAFITGPALVTSGNSTTFVEENWEWHLDRANMRISPGKRQA